MSDRAFLFLAVMASLLTGCMTVASVGTSTIDVQAAKARAAEIDAQPMTRAGVHELLGEPWLANETLGVEVHRLQGKQRNLGVIFAPYPVPIPFVSDKLEVFTLVSYGSGGQVVAKAFGYLHAAPGEWPSLVLRAGDFQFVHAPPDTLSVSLDRFLKDRIAYPIERACTVLIGCESVAVDETAAAGFCTCAANLYVDEGKRRTLVLARPVLLPGTTVSETGCRESGGHFRTSDGQVSGMCHLTSPLLHPQTLTPGDHQLRFTLGRSDEGIRGELTCRPGEVIFATLAGGFMTCQRLDRPLAPRPKHSGAGEDVLLSQQVPMTTHELRVVVYEDGHWLFPQDSQTP